MFSVPVSSSVSDLLFVLTGGQEQVNEYLEDASKFPNPQRLTSKSNGTSLSLLGLSILIDVRRSLANRHDHVVLLKGRICWTSQFEGL